MIKKIVLFSVIAMLFSCPGYKDHFKRSYDFLQSTSLLTNWYIEDGVIVNVESTTDVPVDGGSVYSLEMINILNEKSSTFETSTSGTDFGIWQESPDVSGDSASPNKAIIVTDDKMSGDKYLHLDVAVEPNKQFFYFQFDVEESKEYMLRYDCYAVKNCIIQMSYGIGDSDYSEKTYPIDRDETRTVLYPLDSFSNTIDYEFRFGLRDPGPTTNYTFELYVDRIAFYQRSNHSISKYITIYNPDDLSTDTGFDEEIDNTDIENELFYEGVYKLMVYAKKGSSDTLTLQLGDVIETYILTDQWQLFTLVNSFTKDQEDFIIQIYPTYSEELLRFPGNIYITHPELYFLPDFFQ